MAQPQMRRAIESGVPDNQQYLHPLLKKNYGDWKYHDRPRPGVLHHVAHGGDEVWTVRAGNPAGTAIPGSTASRSADARSPPRPRRKLGGAS